MLLSMRLGKRVIRARAACIRLPWFHVRRPGKPMDFVHKNIRLQPDKYLGQPLLFHHIVLCQQTCRVLNRGNTLCGLSKTSATNRLPSIRRPRLLRDAGIIFTPRNSGLEFTSQLLAFVK